ncbi:hypothetical protein Enr8_09220 [Blastopirellula retiformator]|uniref:Uncharacterized protein n=1 Tax=Blastopirellula retiformator TaxID=2527970 RepID=A0A5C5VKV8_9BACT|nr:hypothetical protein Enr8_09220 [Blastopirellula retiformator]
MVDDVAANVMEFDPIAEFERSTDRLHDRTGDALNQFFQCDYHRYGERQDRDRHVLNLRLACPLFLYQAL